MKNKEDYVKDFTETRSVCKYRRQHPRSLCGWNWKSWKAYDRCSKRGQNRKEHRRTNYPEPAISKEAQDEIKKILWNERMKAETKKDAERMKH